MRNILVTIILSTICAFNLKAGETIPDDTLAKGQNSKFLAFPFVLRSPETSWGFGLASAYFFKAKLQQVQKHH